MGLKYRLRAGRAICAQQANIEWLAWNEEIACERKHGTHGEIVAVRAERDRAALVRLPPAAYLVVDRTTRVVARDGLCSFEGRRYYLPDAKLGERVELVLGATELEVHSVLDGRRLARHERGRPSRVLPDPVENSTNGIVGRGPACIANAGPDQMVWAAPDSASGATYCPSLRRCARCSL